MGRPNQLFTFKELKALTPKQRTTLKKRAVRLIEASSTIFRVIIVNKARPPKGATKRRRKARSSK